MRVWIIQPLRGKDALFYCKPNILSHCWSLISGNSLLIYEHKAPNKSTGCEFEPLYILLSWTDRTGKEMFLPFLNGSIFSRKGFSLWWIWVPTCCCWLKCWLHVLTAHNWNMQHYFLTRFSQEKAKSEHSLWVHCKNIQFYQIYLI